jgi:hypothetical protein
MREIPFDKDKELQKAILYLAILTALPIVAFYIMLALAIL